MNSPPKKNTRAKALISILLMPGFSHAQAFHTSADESQTDVPLSDNLNPFQINATIHIYNNANYENPMVASAFLKISHSKHTRTVHAVLLADQLMPGSVYSIWWLAVRQPQFCQSPWACRASDLVGNDGDSRAGVVAIWANDLIADYDGIGKAVFSLIPNSKLISDPPLTYFDTSQRADYKIYLRAH